MGECMIFFVVDKDFDVWIIVEDVRGCWVFVGFLFIIVLGDIYVFNVFFLNDDGLNDYFIFFSDNILGE